MSKIQLPNVSLIALTGPDYKTKEHLEVLQKSAEGIRFHEVKLIQLSSIKDIDTWNKAVIYELPDYVESDYMLFIHADGYILNPHLWSDLWLNYDYIGAPWPLPTDNISYRDESGNIVRVGNSVSLRSKKLMDLIATKPEKEFWAIKDKYGNTNEDGFICSHNRNWLESKGCKFAPLEVAVHFSKEHEIPENQNINSFAFHSI